MPLLPILLATVTTMSNTAENPMVAFIRTHSADLQSLQEKYDIPFSQTRQARLHDFFVQWQTDLGRTNFDALDREGQVDYLLQTNYLKHELRQLDIDAAQLSEIKEFIPFVSTIAKLEEDRIAGKAIDPEASASTVAAMKKQIDELRSSIEKRMQSEKFKRTLANRASMATRSLQRAFTKWYQFYNGYVPTFAWWVEAPYKSADTALQEYARFLREKVAMIPPGNDNFIVGDPIGHDALMEELRNELIPYTPEELVEIANKEYEWCLNEMLKASREMGFGDDWKKALEKVKQDHVAPGEQPAFVKFLAEEAIEFVEKNKLVTVPPLAKETWRMEMMSPEAQLVNPFFLGGEAIIVSFPTDTMSHEQKLMSMRANNKHFSRATVHHELIPGHNLQAFMNARYSQHRAPFHTPFWTEGWALWFEMQFWDLGFQKSPENRVGMLFWRMHRCARIIFSLSFHLEKMSPDECIKLLIDKVGHEPSSAEAEVRRSLSGAYSPLYQCAYMHGALQFRSLHNEIVGSKKMTDQQFHDKILQSGNMPIAMLRLLFTNDKLTRDYTPTWRFYG